MTCSAHQLALFHRRVGFRETSDTDERWGSGGGGRRTQGVRAASRLVEVTSYIGLAISPAVYYIAYSTAEKLDLVERLPFG